MLTPSPSPARLLVALALAWALPALAGRPSGAADVPPNLVVILADDLGYGDVSAYNPERGRIPTPHVDRLAAEGMRFTDAHSSSGVCSPSRYTLLTGRYHWRTRLQQGIVPVFGAPLIAADRLTLPGFLKQQGYATACVGKWHLGWDWPIPEDRRADFLAQPAGPRAAAGEPLQRLWADVFSKPIPGGPTSRGFDEYFGTDVPNWPPYCFIENDRTRGIPSEFLPDRFFERNQAGRRGPALPGWSLEPILPGLADRAAAFLKRAAARPDPFFLYVPLTSPHTPLAVNPKWRGRSGLNAYADFVMETDAAVGTILEALRQSGAAERTLVVFTSDNGCAPYVGAAELEAKGHYPSGPLRGYKADAWEGGHRVPFVVRWPGRVAAGAVCDRLALQADLLATMSAILEKPLPAEAGEDSVSLLPLLRGGAAPVRESAVHQSSRGLPAYRSGAWKAVFGPGGGGYGPAEGPGPAQLYHLESDPGERRDLAAQHPEIVARLTREMQSLVDRGRSTPGPDGKNDVPVRWRRFLR